MALSENAKARLRRSLASGVYGDEVSTAIDAVAAATYNVVLAGEFTTVGGDAAEAITATGALATDLALVTMHTVGATPVTILTASASTDAVDVTLSADPSTDHVLTWVVLRAQ